MTTFTDKYVEYGPADTGKTAAEFSQKVTTNRIAAQQKPQIAGT